MFAVEDLFVTGIGFDIAGAWLVASGLLARPKDIKIRGSTLVGANIEIMASLIQDRFRGELGLFYLLLGFGLQAFGWYLTVAVDDPGAGSVWGVFAAAAVPLVGVLVSYRQIKQWRVGELIVGVASYGHRQGVGFTNVPPGDSEIRGLAVRLGWPEDRGLSDSEFVRKHFHVP